MTWIRRNWPDLLIVLFILALIAGFVVVLMGGTGRLFGSRPSSVVEAPTSSSTESSNSSTTPAPAITPAPSSAGEAGSTGNQDGSQPFPTPQVDTSSSAGNPSTPSSPTSSATGSNTSPSGNSTRDSGTTKPPANDAARGPSTTPPNASSAAGDKPTASENAGSPRTAQGGANTSNADNLPVIPANPVGGAAAPSAPSNNAGSSSAGSSGAGSSEGSRPQVVTPAPRPEPAPAPTVRPAPQPAPARPVPETRPPVTPRPQVQVSRSGVPTKSDFRISAGLYSDASAAQAVAAKIQALGYPAYVLPSKDDTQVVLVGPFGNRRDAVAASSDIARVHQNLFVYAPSSETSSSASGDTASGSTQGDAPSSATPSDTASSAPATSAPASGGSVYLQVGAYRNQASADAQVEKLRGQGYAPTTRTGANGLIRILVGPYSEAELDSAKGKLSSDGLSSFAVRGN